jgi:hypothetical protein
VRLQDRGWRQSGRQQVAIQPLYVLRLQLVEPVVADAGDELVHDELAVPDERRGPHLARRDGVEPVLKPLADGGRLTGRPCGSRIPLTLKPADLRDDVRTLRTRDVPTVSGAMVLLAHRHIAVPPAVAAPMN